MCFRLLAPLIGACVLQGGVQNFTVAHKYFARVLELTSGDNVRALYGIAAAQSALAASGAPSAANGELGSLSKQRLLQLYGQSAPGKAALVESVLSDDS